MKNKELINILKRYGEDVEVTISNKKGTFSDINCIEMQEFYDKYGNEHALIIIGGYDSKKTIVEENKEKCFETESNVNNGIGDFIDFICNLRDGECNERDVDFLDDVNAKLDKQAMLNKLESLNAKKKFNLDKERDEYEEDFDNSYNEAVDIAMTELFDCNKPLESRDTCELVGFMFENGWAGEIGEDIFERNALIPFMYGKVSDYVREYFLNGCVAEGSDGKKYDLFLQGVKEYTDYVLNDLNFLN